MKPVGSAGASRHTSGVTNEESALKTAMISSVLLILLGATGGGVSAQPGAPSAERFVLTGMVTWSGTEGVAWLQEPDLTRNEIVVLRIGQSVGAWKLTRFLDNGVELDGPGGKVLVPLHNVGAGGTAVAAGAPVGPAPGAASTARTFPGADASRAVTSSVPGSPAPGPVGEANPATPNVSALGEALNRARAERAQRQAANAQEQPREAGPSGSQAVRGTSTSSGATSSDGASADAAGEGGTNKVIQLPRGGGRQGIRELFGSR
jgi:hypothetical protein